MRTRGKKPRPTLMQASSRGIGSPTRLGPQAVLAQGVWSPGARCSGVPPPPIQGFPEKVRGEGGRALF